MKKYFALMSLVLGAIAFTGCTNSNIEESPVKEGNFSFTVTMDAMTRATVEKNNVVFTPGDKVAFGAAEHATNDTVTKAMIAEYSANDGKFYCDTVLDETKSFDFYALWPYQAGSKGASFNLPAKLKNPNQYSTYVYVGKNAFGQIAQNVDSATQYAPMIGVSTVGSPAAGASVNLHHLASMLEFEVKNATSAPVKFSSLKMTVGDGTKFCGTYFVDMTTGALSPSGDNYVYDNCTVSIVDDSDEVAAGSTWKFFMPIAPVTLAAGTEITFDITASDGTLCRVVKHIPATASVTFEAGKWNTQNLDYTGASTITHQTLAEVLDACSSLVNTGSNSGTSADSYDVVNAVVVAQNGKNVIISDGTAYMLVYTTTTVSNGDVISLTGNIQNYYGILEWASPTITKTGTADVTFPTPVTYTDELFTSYTSAPSVQYVKVSGPCTVDGKKIDIAGSTVQLYYTYANTNVSFEGYNGKDVVCEGFLFGYNNSSHKASFLATSVAEDSSAPSLTLDPETLTFGANDGVDDFKRVTATVLNTTITDITSDATWCLGEMVGPTVVVTVLEANTTGSARTATLTVNTAAGISKTITVTQEAAAVTGATIAQIYQNGPGKYSLTGAMVYAVNSNNSGVPMNVIIGDATGFMLVYYPTFTGAETLTAGQIVDITGPVIEYKGNNAIVYEFSKETVGEITTPVEMTVTGTAPAIDYPNPVTLTSAQYNALIDKDKVLQVQYIAVTGVNSSAGVTTADGDVYNTTNGENVSFSGMTDKKVNLTGFTFGVTQSETAPKVKVLVTNVEVDATAPSLTVSPTSLSFAAEDADASAAKEITCTVENTTLTTAVASESWLTATVNGTTVSVYPSANTSTSARTATVTINTAAGLSKSVTVTQQGKSSGDGKAYTITWNATNNSASIASYTDSWSVTADGLTCNMANFNNNKNEWNYVKCGRKNNASVATIITATAIPEAIKTVKITIDAVTASKINSVKLYTGNTDSSWTDAGSFTVATGEQSVSITSPATGKYYKLEFDCASGSSNGLLTLSKLVFTTD
ncbi:MAG: BACON domain-containing protein [Bacteroidales bacterium]|nr:BACON domain-containing protein [Bacteroidales bacterium]